MAKKTKEPAERTLVSKVENMRPDELVAKFAPDSFELERVEADVERLKAAEAAKAAFKEEHREMLKEKDALDKDVREARRSILASLVDAFNHLEGKAWEDYFKGLDNVPGVSFIPRYEVRGIATRERRKEVAAEIARLEERLATADLSVMAAATQDKLDELRTEEADFDRQDEAAILAFCIAQFPHALMVNHAVFDAYVEALENMAYFAKQPLVDVPARLIACMLPAVGNVNAEEEAE